MRLLSAKTISKYLASVPRTKVYWQFKLKIYLMPFMHEDERKVKKNKLKLLKLYLPQFHYKENMPSEQFEDQ